MNRLVPGPRRPGRTATGGTETRLGTTSGMVYTLVLYANYENVFIRLQMGPNKDRSLIRYAKHRILGYSQLRLSRVLQLTRRSTDIMRIRSKEDVDEIIRSVDMKVPSNK